MQLAGKKLVRLFPPSQNWRADATDGDDFQPSLYTIDLLRPDFEQHPNMKVSRSRSPKPRPMFNVPPLIAHSGAI
jgi:hypothetical protein